MAIKSKFCTKSKLPFSNSNPYLRNPFFKANISHPSAKFGYLLAPFLSKRGRWEVERLTLCLQLDYRIIKIKKN